MATGRVKGQISLSGARTVRNSRSAAVRNPHTTSTVGLRGAKATTNTHRPRVHGRPSVKQEGLMRTKGSKTSTNFSRGAGTSVSRNQTAYNPHATPTVGLRGAKLGDTKGTAKRSNLARSAGDKNSINPYTTPVHANETQGLKKASKRAPLQNLQSSGTGGKSGGGKGIAFMGNRRQVSSSLPPQKNYNASIPAAVRRAAARAPSVGSSKPSFTSRITKILSK